jgi:hypothetical protein
MWITTSTANTELMTLGRTVTNYDQEFGFCLDSNGRLQFWDYSHATGFGFPDTVSGDVSVTTGIVLATQIPSTLDLTW